MPMAGRLILRTIPNSTYFVFVDFRRLLGACDSTEPASLLLVFELLFRRKVFEANFDILRELRPPFAIGRIIRR
jgi:hypothetical protein